MTNVLDATPLTERGKELVAKIADKVARTQLFVLSELPNELHITRAQFDSMMDTEETESYMSSIDAPGLVGNVKKAYVFYTPHNAMDVVVVDDVERTAV